MTGARRPRTYAQIVALVDRTLPLYEAALRKLEALRPPGGDEQAVRAWLAADRRAAAALHALGDAALRRDYPGVVVAAARVQAAVAVGRTAAGSLGLRVCAKSS